MELDIPGNNAIEVSHLTNDQNNEEFITVEEYEAIFADNEDKQASKEASATINERKSDTSLESEVKLFKDYDTNQAYTDSERNLTRLSTNIEKNSKFNKIILNDTLARKRKKEKVVEKKATCKCLIF